MPSAQDIIPTNVGSFNRSAGSHSYLYSPHLLYSPHILYPSGILSGFMPTTSSAKDGILSESMVESIISGIKDILPMVDNKDIR